MLASAPDDSLQFGPLTLRPAQRLATFGAEPLALGSRAFDLLLALAERRDRVVSKAELLSLVWPGRVVDEANLYVHVAALRRLLGPRVICNLPGRGYRFTLEGGTAAPASPSVAGEIQRGAGSPGALLNPVPGLHRGSAGQVLAPLYGREQDLHEAQKLALPGALLTVTGAGGVGKSSLARHLMAAGRTAQPDGAAWVDLAALTDGAALAAAVAQAAGIALTGSVPPQEALARALAPLQMMLVLDNAEHLLAEVADLVSTVHPRAPGLTWVVTSQAPLKLAGEQVFRLGPLSCPVLGHGAERAVASPTDLQAALDHGAVRLLLERVREADRHFALDGQNLPAAVALCRRLDGLPLAIELAAARVPALGLAGVLAALNARFALLSRGRRDAPVRQPSLSAALSWSHELLGPATRQVFRGAAVFAGSFSLDQAVAVLSEVDLDEWAVVDALAELVDRGLVLTVDTPSASLADTADRDDVGLGDGCRYRLLESPRAFARDRLVEAGEEAALQRRHALAFCRRFEAAAVAYFDGEQRIDTLRAGLAPDLDNGRAAWAWAQAHAPTLAVGLAADMARELDESASQGARQMLEATQAAARPPCPAPLRLRWLLASALAQGRMRPDLGVAHAREAAALAEQLDDARALYRALAYLVCSPASASLGPDEQMRALAQLRAIDDRRWPPILRAVRANAELFSHYAAGRLEEAAHWLRQRIGLLALAGCPDTRSLVNLVDVELSLGQLDQALQTGRELERRLQGRDQPLTQFHAWRNLCAVWLTHGDAAQARSMAQRGWPLAARFGLQPDWLDHLAHLCQLEGRPRCAAQLLGLADALYARHGRQRPPVEARAAAAAGADRDQMPAEAWQQARDDGAALADDALAVERVAGLAFARADVTGALYPVVV